MSTKYTKEILEPACKKAACAARLCEILKIQRISKHIYKLIKKYKIDISHWITPVRRGKSKFYDMIGKKINHFTILEVFQKPQQNSKRLRYEIKCKCDCGTIETYRTCYFTKITRCVICDPKPRTNINNTLYRGIPIRYYHSAKQRAKNKGYEFLVSMDYLQDLLVTQNYKCAITGVDIHLDANRNFQTASIDRIDSSKGYIEGNVQWVNKVINIMKQTMDTKDFLYMCKLVAKNEIIDNEKVLKISQKFTQCMKNKKWKKQVENVTQS